MDNKKRIYRELSDDTKQKISNASKGRPKSQSHRQHISQAMTDYWKTIPHRPTPSDNPSPQSPGRLSNKKVETHKSLLSHFLLTKWGNVVFRVRSLLKTALKIKS